MGSPLIEAPSPPVAVPAERRPSAPGQAAIRRRGALLTAGTLAALAAAGSAWWWIAARPTPPDYMTVAVTRGPIARYIVATGTVNPEATVQVGSYVSGTIIEISCDFNTEVKAGQLCARIDPRPYQVIVDQDAASLAGVKAQLAKDTAAADLARLSYRRDRELVAQGIVSRETVDNEQSALAQAHAQIAVDRATIAQRSAELRAAEVNLGYTRIVSPVDGTVVSRNVDVGQTVAASFQTPTLFLVAKDLTRMQVDTSVSESDIGGARADAPATFTVEAYPGIEFRGRIAQIRRAPVTVQNVVTYDVVIGVTNADLKLLPGMTANVRIVAKRREDALRVPLTALRFTPRAARTGVPAAGAKTDSGARVWVLRGDELRAVPVTTGLDDGTVVEVVSGELHVGDAVTIAESRAAGQKATGIPSHAPAPRL
jgi:HlyD family secretion protein